MNSNWNYPTTMWVGKDRIKDLSIACNNLKIYKPLLVTDSGLAKSKIVTDVLDNLKNNGILVHCYAGKQRSACVIVGYLMKYGNLSMKNAILAVKSKRLVVG